MVEQSLKDKTVKGVGWSAADAFLGQGMTFIVGLVLARLLSPEEYGLIGICLIFTTILNGIVDSGFSNALIRKKNVEEVDYNTMFITNMLFSIVLYGALFFISPLIASFFGRSELTSLLRTTGFILLLQALSITQITILTRNIDFKTKTKASFFSAIVSGFIGIWMAYKGYGVWSLVGQQLSNKAAYSASLWLLNRWIPNFHFNKDSFKYMWGFGWKLMVSGLLNNLWNQMNQVIVGKFYSPASLGQYTQSNTYAELFSANITSVVQRVSFPALSALQDEKERLISAYRKVIKVTMFVTCTLLFLLGAMSEPLLYCLIGPQWYEASTYLPLICISMTLYPLHAINLNMLQIQGRSDIYLILEIVKKLIAIVPILIGIFVSIYWMLVALIVTGFVSFLLNSYYTGKYLGYSSFSQLRDVIPYYCMGLTIACPVYFIKMLPINNWVVLVLQLLVGGLFFVFISVLFRVEEFREIFGIVKKVINKWVR